MCFSKRFFAHSEYPYTPSGRRKRFLHLNATAPYNFALNSQFTILNLLDFRNRYAVFTLAECAEAKALYTRVGFEVFLYARS